MVWVREGPDVAVLDLPVPSVEGVSAPDGLVGRVDGCSSVPYVHVHRRRRSVAVVECHGVHVPRVEGHVGDERGVEVELVDVELIGIPSDEVLHGVRTVRLGDGDSVVEGVLPLHPFRYYEGDQHRRVLLHVQVHREEPLLLVQRIAIRSQNLEYQVRMLRTVGVEARDGYPQGGDERSGERLYLPRSRESVVHFEGGERVVPSGGPSVVLDGGDGQRVVDPAHARAHQADGVVAEPGRQDDVGVSLSPDGLDGGIVVVYGGCRTLAEEVHADLDPVLDNESLGGVAVLVHVLDPHDLLQIDDTVSEVAVPVVVESVRGDLHHRLVRPVVEGHDVIGRAEGTEVHSPRSVECECEVAGLCVGTEQDGVLAFGDLLGRLRKRVDEGVPVVGCEVSSGVPYEGGCRHGRDRDVVSLADDGARV